MKDALFLFHALKHFVSRCETGCSSVRNTLFHTGKHLPLLAFGNFHQIDSDTDKNNGKRLRPTETVLPQNKRSDSCHNQNQITIDSYHRCLEIFQSDREQHITYGSRENQHKHQDKERRPMERHGEYRSVEAGNHCHYNSGYGRTGKCISQHGHCTDRSKNTMTQNQVDSIDDGTNQAEEVVTYNYNPVPRIA